MKFTKLLAEDLPEVSMAYKITAVPTFILLRKGDKLDRVDGANAAELTLKVTKQVSHWQVCYTPSKELISPITYLF